MQQPVSQDLQDSLKPKYYYSHSSTQALQEPTLQDQNLDFSCSSQHHVPQCNWLQALHDVDLNDVMITARCC
jgi:hypothetical protein